MALQIINVTGTTFPFVGDVLTVGTNTGSILASVAAFSNSGTVTEVTQAVGLPVDLLNGGTVALAAGTADVGTVHVSGTVPVSSPAVAYKAQSALLTASAVPPASTPVVAAGAAVDVLTIWNTGTAGNVWLDPSGGTAAVGSGIPLYAGGGSFTFRPPPTGSITAIADSGTITISAAGA